MSVNLELRKALQRGMDEAKKQGKELVVAVLDEKEESLAIISTYPDSNTVAQLKMLQAVCECALSDEENNGEETGTNLIH